MFESAALYRAGDGAIFLRHDDIVRRTMTLHDHRVGARKELKVASGLDEPWPGESVTGAHTGWSPGQDDGVSRAVTTVAVRGSIWPETETASAHTGAHRIVMEQVRRFALMRSGFSGH